MESRNLTPLVLFFVAWLFCLPLLLLHDIPEHDVIGRYAPMADAFAAGDWRYAFHPRIPMLHPLAGGIIAWIFGCSGLAAVMLASSLFYAAAIFPLYGIFHRIFGKRLAFWSCFLYIFCSHLTRLGFSGLRDSAKSFAAILVVYGLICIYRERKHLTGYLWCGFGCGLLVIIRGDSVLFALLLFAAAAIFEIFRGRKVYLPWRSALAGCVLFLTVLPSLIYNYQVIGYPVPETRFGVILCRLENSTGINFLSNDNPEIQLSVPKKLKSKAIPVPAVKAAPKVKLIDYSPPPEAHPSASEAMYEFISSLIKGFYPYFFIFAIPVIIWRIRKRKWLPEETILLTVLLGHAFVVVGQILVHNHYFYVSRRYLLPLIPLYFAWSAIGAYYAWKFFHDWKPKIFNSVFAVCLITVLCIILYLDASDRIIKNYTSRKKRNQRKAALAISGWIRNDFNDPSARVHRSLHWYSYRGNLRPVVASNGLEETGYLSGGQFVPITSREIASGGFLPDYIVFIGRKPGKKVPKTQKAYKLMKNYEFGKYYYFIFKKNPGERL